MLLIAIFFFHIVFLLKTGFRADGPPLPYVDERPDRNSTHSPKLVTSGPYAHLRHPIYTGQILAMSLGGARYDRGTSAPCSLSRWVKRMRLTGKQGRLPKACAMRRSEKSADWCGVLANFTNRSWKTPRLGARFPL